MTDLKELYIAMCKRVDLLKNNIENLENPIVIELRLDIEQLIALICKEKNIQYDGMLSEMNPEEILDQLWRKKDDT
jgi:hypothetical protein